MAKARKPGKKKRNTKKTDLVTFFIKLILLFYPLNYEVSKNPDVGFNLCVEFFHGSNFKRH